MSGMCRVTKCYKVVGLHYVVWWHRCRKQSGSVKAILCGVQSAAGNVMILLQPKRELFKSTFLFLHILYSGKLSKEKTFVNW